MNPLIALLAASWLQATPAQDIECSLAFRSKSWSAVYERMEGSGTVSCSDGTRRDVAIRARGLGLAVGKWKIDDGKGKFMSVTSIDETLGTYVALSASAGASKAGSASMLMKEHVGLALAGKGHGFDLGVAVSEFTIDTAAPAAASPEPEH